MTGKKRLALYWASSCGGCEIALANLHDLFLELTAQLELFFCPAFVDTKTKDVLSLPDGAIALTLFNGALRTDENVEMAQLLRRKSRVLVAFGTCAHCGGIPALSNLSTRDDHLRTVYADTASGQAAAVPREETAVTDGVLRLPRFHARVKSLASVVPVDFTVPGCPPEPSTIWAALKPFVGETELPAAGSVLGGRGSTVCEECARQREGTLLARFRRIVELVPDPVRCLLDQGLPCVGLATRGGCGALCPAAQVPCSGCYGPPEGVYDQAAKLASVLGSVLDVSDLKGREAAEIAERVDRVLDTLPDVAGVCGKYSLATRRSKCDARPGAAER
jgi:F420-non-reducing hydrogenase small subunit